MIDPSGQEAGELTLRVIEARGRDVGRGLARIDPADLELLGLSPGQAIEITGKRTTVARAMPAFGGERGQKVIQIDAIIRENAQVGLDEQVTIKPASCHLATSVKLKLLSSRISEGSSVSTEEYLAKLLDGVPVAEGDTVRAVLFGTGSQDYKVIETEPSGAVIIQLTTHFEIVPGEASAPTASIPSSRLSYEDIGGLKREITRLRELIEIPFKHPEIFENLGIRAPRGILLSGPPGVGKSLMARVVAEHSQASLLRTSGPEIIFRYHNQRQPYLEELFSEARQRQPAVVFIDEIDVLASRRCLAEGEVEKRIVAELLALIDGLQKSDRVIIIASSMNAPDLDLSLRRRGRFERQINVGIPNHRDRTEILEIHSRGMPLGEDVDLRQLAELTQGFVGADLLALCGEAALSAMRESIPTSGPSERLSFDVLTSMKITMGHFLDALRAITPVVPYPAPVELIEVGWEDVGGLDDVRERLMEAVIMPLRSPRLFAHVRARPTRGVLLHGPTGTGKTLLARALAGETGINFVSTKGLEMLSKRAGESETVVRELFQRARQQAPSIIFLDGIDAISPVRQKGEMAGMAEKVLFELLREIDSLEQLRGVVVLAETNKLEDVAPELLRPGRFDLMLEVPIPESSALKEIFKIHLRNRPVADDIDLDHLVRLACGFTGADVEAICHRAAMAAIKEHLERDPSKAPQALLVRQQHLADSIAEMCLRKLHESGRKVYDSAQLG